MNQATTTRQTLIAWLDRRVDAALTIDLTSLAETISMALVGAAAAEQAELAQLSERLLARVRALLTDAHPEIALDAARTLALLTAPATTATTPTGRLASVAAA